MKSLRTFGLIIISTAIAGLGSLPITAQAADGGLDGNRYLQERYYAADISAARTYLEAVLKHGKWTDKKQKLTIVDVRDATEYRDGHPEGAFHVPYPRIYQACQPNPANAADQVTRTEDGGTCLYGAVASSAVTMSDEQLFRTFEAMFSNKNERLALLCRTGSRSARAANVLTRPEKYLGAAYSGRGFTRAYNIWEGFVGQPLVPINPYTGRVIGPANEVTPVTLDDGATAFSFKAYGLDVNNDSVLNASDNDGWRYHQGLPFETRMQLGLLNIMASPYYWKP